MLAPLPSAPIHVLLYQSSAVRGMTAADLHAIRAASHAWNAACGVTGLLVYGEIARLPGLPGQFVQWLEGPEAEVRTLFRRIARDRRHTDLTMLADGPAARVAGADARLFPAWTRAVKRLADVPATLDGFLEYARSTHEGLADDLPAAGTPTTTRPPQTREHRFNRSA